MNRQTINAWMNRQTGICREDTETDRQEYAKRDKETNKQGYALGHRHTGICTDSTVYSILQTVFCTERKQ